MANVELDTSVVQERPADGEVKTKAGRQRHVADEMQTRATQIADAARTLLLRHGMVRYGVTDLQCHGIAGAGAGSPVRSGHLRHSRPSFSTVIHYCKYRFTTGRRTSTVGVIRVR